VLGCDASASEELERVTRAEARLEEAQRIAHVGSWEWDVARNEVTWSDELHRIYGVTRDAFRPHVRELPRARPPRGPGAGREVGLRRFRNFEPFIYDHRIVRPDGAVRMLHTRGEVIAAAGKAQRLVGCCWT